VGCKAHCLCCLTGARVPSQGAQLPGNEDDRSSSSGEDKNGVQPRFHSIRLHGVLTG
jgi:hypothetical protein